MEFSLIHIVTAAAEGSNLLEQEFAVVVLLMVAALVAIVIRRIRLPYTVALVVMGLILSFFPNFLNLTFSSEIILDILVPPLIFEATLHIPWRKLRSDLAPILTLALLGTLMGTFLVGYIVVQLLGVPLLAAIAFGALISATDPVAVIAFFRNLGVSKRLAILVEGESLFNDGVAIVIFGLAVGAAEAGTGITPVEAISEFMIVAFGGLAIGLFLGYIVSYIILKNVDDHLIETSTTVALAFGAFTVAESFGSLFGIGELHLSGILAVVAAGLMVGNIGFENTSPTTKNTLNNFWEFLTFVVNSLVFLAIGLEIVIAQLLQNIGPVIVAVFAILLSRPIIIYSITWIYGRLQPKRKIPINYRHVMYWGGLRGAISLALALTLTGTVFGDAIAQELRVMTFGVVLFTLLVQGMTIEKLILRLRLADKPRQRLEQQLRLALLYTKHGGVQELHRLRNNGILFEDIWRAMKQVYDEEIAASRDSLRAHLQRYPELEQEMYLQTREDVLRAERSALHDASRRGLVSEEVEQTLSRDLYNRLAALEVIKENRGLGAYEKGSEGEDNE